MTSLHLGPAILLLGGVLAARGCDWNTGPDDPRTHIGGWVLEGVHQPDRVGIEGVTVLEVSQGITTVSYDPGRFVLGQSAGGSSTEDDPTC